MSVYSTVPIKKPGRNVFNLSHSFKGSINIGELVPIARPIECVPGDTMITGNITDVELNPIVTNFKGELYFETWQFFVSNDMLYQSGDSGKFTEILASMQNPKNILPLPYITSSTPSTSRNYLTYLYGLKNGISPSNLNIVAYPSRAIIKIINEWFRDENLENEYTGSVFSSANFYHINYKKDRYTSAFLTTQRGNPITIPLGTVASLKIKDNLPIASIFGSGATSLQLYANPNAPSAGDKYSSLVANFADNTQKGNANTRFANTILDGFEVDLSQATAASINDLRLANKLQKWLERCQLCGTRIKEYLLANYGVTPNDETLQRPVLIGHTKVPVVISDIIANIKATNKSTQTLQNEQGSRGGYGNASSSFRYGKWFCKEFGWIITLGALRPKAVYTGGIHKSLTKDSVIDYFNPIFEHLGQQAIKNKELLVTGTPNTDNAIFGYQDIYNEMRHLEDFITEDLLTSGYQTKNIWRNFVTTPTLSRSFIEVKPTDYDYLFAVPSSNAPQAFFDSANIIKAVRPISKRSVPSL